MNLSAPKKIVFIISAVLFALALATGLGVAVPFITVQSFWCAIAAYTVLAVGNLFKGL